MINLLAWIALVAALMVFGLMAPALAESTANHGGTGCTMVATPTETHVAELRCTNVLTSGMSQTSDLLEVEGLSVLLLIEHTSGDIPDRFTVAAPAEFQAIPAEMDLLEGSSGVILIYEWVGM